MNNEENPFQLIVDAITNNLKTKETKKPTTFEDLFRNLQNHSKEVEPLVTTAKFNNGKIVTFPLFVPLSSFKQMYDMNTVVSYETSDGKKYQQKEVQQERPNGFSKKEEPLVKRIKYSGVNIDFPTPMLLKDVENTFDKKLIQAIEYTNGDAESYNYKKEVSRDTVDYTLSVNSSWGSLQNALNYLSMSGVELKKGSKYSDREIYDLLEKHNLTDENCVPRNETEYIRSIFEDEPIYCYMIELIEFEPIDSLEQIKNIVNDKVSILNGYMKYFQITYEDLYLEMVKNNIILPFDFDCLPK